MNTGYEVAPLSRKNIRECARNFRNFLKIEAYCDIVTILDVILPKIDEDFTLVICDPSEIDGADGLTDPANKIIQIAKLTYEGAIKGNGRDRMTMAHELAHYLLHDNMKFARRVSPSTKAYRDSEWQANAFGGELLVSCDHLEGINSIEDIVERFGVSYEAAMIQYKAFKKDGLI